MPGNLAQKLVTEFEQLQQAHPYVPYGAHVKKQAEELLAKSKRGQRKQGQPWNFRQQFTDDELKLIILDYDFARQTESPSRACGRCSPHRFCSERITGGCLPQTDR